MEWEANDARLRICEWWSDLWNKLDIIGTLLFVIGTYFRFSPYTVLLEPAEVILSFDLFIFYFRFLEYLTFVKSIGPKVIMIGKMV